MPNRIKEILATLKNGIIDISLSDVQTMNSICTAFINNQTSNLDVIKDIIEISNILYNNTSRTILPLEDGLYDLVVAKYNVVTGNKAPVGAIPVDIDRTNIVEDLDDELLDKSNDGMVDVVTIIPDHSNMIYYDRIAMTNKPLESDYAYHEDNTLIDNITRGTAHSYPELVGTLHKCKFVTLAEARSVNADEDNSVMIFDRDFLAPNFKTVFNIYASKNMPVSLIAELKYDGVSIEMEVAGDTVISAISRGDTANDEASDFTPIFKGYKFARAANIDPSTKFGIKFEAIITYENLQRMSEMFGKTYKNARVAIIGILGSRDARKYRDFITLVPIKTAGLNITDPVQEVNFLNTYYSKDVPMKYAVLQAPTNTIPMNCYTSLMYQVEKFKSEAEFMRPYLNFMYDGVVISYTDPDVKNFYGRKNSIDLWSMAIKFGALSKNTYFYGYKYTVGQDGRITPMAYFAPVEFNGTIHDKTTVHSFKRVKTLGLKKGDVVNIKYVNDVICYLTNPMIKFNTDNPNPVIEFIDHCPCCGTPLYVSDSEDSAYCPNFNCPGRVIARVSNMLKKLNIKDFGRAYIEKLGIDSFHSLLNCDKQKAISIIGQTMADKLFDRINTIKTKKYPDYRIIGAIGFSNISIDRWKCILCEININSLINLKDKELYNTLNAINGIGPTIAKTIVHERADFISDLKLICSMPNIYSTCGNRYDAVQVRFSGFRNKLLEGEFNALGFDADGDKSVTKKTQILVIPYEGFTSSKVKKAKEGCLILTESQAFEYIEQLKHSIVR